MALTLLRYGQSESTVDITLTASYTQLPGTATLAYAEALDQSLAREHNAVGTGLDFHAKRLRGGRYWYLRQRLSGKTQQFYLGPETPALLAAMERQTALWEQGREDARSLEKAVSMAQAAGCVGIDHRAYKVLTAVAQAGYFRAGGVLIGSYAFVAAGNLLGVSWRRDTTMTQDIDIVASDHAMIALPPGTPPISEVILNAEQGLFAVPMLSHKDPSTSYSIRGSDFRVDLLTPLKGKPRTTQYVKKVQSHAEPLAYLDYLLEDTQKAVLLHKDGVLVNVPNPARLALHKLVVAQRRPPAFAAKARKDRAQAEQLITCLLDQRPGDLWLAIDAAQDYPVANFGKAVIKGIHRLENERASEGLSDYWAGMMEQRSGKP